MNTRAYTHSESELTAVADLRAALRRFHAATDAVASRHGLTARRYDLLAMLHGAPEETHTATGLSALLLLSKNATTELITRAEEAGLVARTGDSDDARIKHVAPTAEGTRRFLGALSELRLERRRLLTIIEEIAGHSAELLATPAPPAAAGRGRRRASGSGE